MTEYSLPKLGNIRRYSPIFKTVRVAKKIWRRINTIASIWGETMLRYLSLDITCYSKFTAFLWLCSQKTVHFSEQVISAVIYYLGYIITATPFSLHHLLSGTGWCVIRVIWRVSFEFLFHLLLVGFTILRNNKLTGFKLRNVYCYHLSPFFDPQHWTLYVTKAKNVSLKKNNYIHVHCTNPVKEFIALY